MVCDGGLTYNGMLDTFNTVIGEGGSYSDAQVADLQLLVQCAATLKMPADVASLADSVVNSQQSNVEFHTLDGHGQVQSSLLGNLEPGQGGLIYIADKQTSALLELVQKWFLGVNEPFADTAYVQISGGLFESAASGPSFLDISQGQVGDCWLLADFEEVAIQQPNAIRTMFIHEGTNTVNGDTTNVYAVRFFSNGVPHYVTVDTFFPVAPHDASGRTLRYADDVTGALWPALLEKAYAEAAAAGWVKVSQSPTNSYAVLQAGWPSYATPAVVNQRSPEHDIDFNAAVAAFRGETGATEHQRQPSRQQARAQPRLPGARLRRGHPFAHSRQPLGRVTGRHCANVSWQPQRRRALSRIGVHGRAQFREHVDQRLRTRPRSGRRTHVGAAVHRPGRRDRGPRRPAPWL